MIHGESSRSPDWIEKVVVRSDVDSDVHSECCVSQFVVGTLFVKIEEVQA